MKPEPVHKRELRLSLIAIAIILTIIGASSLILFTAYWFTWPIMMVILLIATGYFTASKHVYQCPSCKEGFRITKLQDFFSPHGIARGPNGELYEWKILKCPGCSKREKCYRSGYERIP